MKFICFNNDNLALKNLLPFEKLALTLEMARDSEYAQSYGTLTKLIEADAQESDENAEVTSNQSSSQGTQIDLALTMSSVPVLSL